MPNAFTSMGSTPTDWIPSTQKKMPWCWQYSPIPGRSLRNPFANSTEERAIRRVFPSQAANRSSFLTLPSRAGTIRTSTLRAWSRIQGYMLEGYSAFDVTRLSPSRQGNPAATKERPSEVFFTKAISSGEAPTTRAKRPLVSFARSSHFRRWNAPSSRDDSSMRIPAAAARAGIGETPAWLRYRWFAVTGNSAVRIGPTSIGNAPSFHPFVLRCSRRAPLRYGRDLRPLTAIPLLAGDTPPCIPQRIKNVPLRIVFERSGAGRLSGALGA